MSVRGPPRASGVAGPPGLWRTLRTSGQVGQRFTGLESLQKAAEGARSLGVLDEYALALRTEAVACLALTDLRVAGEWEAPARWGQHWAPPVAFDARLERYACADPLGSVFHYLLMGLEFMFRRITHNNCIGCSESS